MKIFLKILLLMIPIFSCGQVKLSVYPDFEILGKDTINRTIDHQKEGPWVYYQKAINAYTCFNPGYSYEQTVDHIISKGNYLNGKRVETWNFFYKTKELKQQDVYNPAGQKDGISIEYFLNGKIKSQQVWERDTLISQTVFWENGLKKFESKCSAGQIESFVIYNKSGNPKFQCALFPSMKIKRLVKFEDNGKVQLLEHKQFGSLIIEEGLLAYL